LLITANPKLLSHMPTLSLFGRSKINGQPGDYPCHLASVDGASPTPGAKFPAPAFSPTYRFREWNRSAPITIASKSPMIEAKVGEKVVIPLVYTKRSEFPATRFK
jgi:hypothetical protein